MISRKTKNNYLDAIYEYGLFSLGKKTVLDYDMSRYLMAEINVYLICIWRNQTEYVFRTL